MAADASKPEIMIIEGQNGTGKTTIMKMIGGIINGLDFDPFRQVPYSSAALSLTTGDKIEIRYDEKNADFPHVVTFRGHSVALAQDKEKSKYPDKIMESISIFRNEALPQLKKIDFELITINRSLSLDDTSSGFIIDPKTNEMRARRKQKDLARKVNDFLRDAQLNYRRFFQAGNLELLPRILKRFQNLNDENSTDSLLKRVRDIRERSDEITRFGLQTDDAELKTLEDFLLDPQYNQEAHAQSLLASYVEVHENRKEARDLIVVRLSQFEKIMDEFLVGKQVRINSKNGLEITGRKGPIGERDLSSGEYHFLYMMVSALLCERAGTILAIDEPELSLHVSWQRKLVSALSKCSSGASPLFFLATHSTAISSAHAHRVQTLSAID